MKISDPDCPGMQLGLFAGGLHRFWRELFTKIKGHRKLNVNFYIDDSKFQRLWNNPDKYMEHLKCFHSVCMPDLVLLQAIVVCRLL